ncbi:MAG: NBR1-Ig-like domain-containing protein [Chloroflexi bacterium]|nr:NBR1-Ig-like domain-containing protein [Chloroflexota bacterium]
MKYRKSLWLIGAMILSIVLSSCSLGATPAPTEDTGALQTQAVSIVFTQVAMQQTQTALAIPLPTNTPIPTVTLGVLPTFAPVGGINTPPAFNTQLPGFTPLASPFATISNISTVTTKNGCNDGAYESEDGVKDGTALSRLQTFNKSWDIRNTGTCPWDEGFSFTFMTALSTPGFNGYDIVISKSKPQDFTKPDRTQNFVLKLTAPNKAGDYIGYWKLKDDAGNFFGPLVWVKITVK